jgi:hypothetical protein
MAWLQVRRKGERWQTVPIVYLPDTNITGATPMCHTPGADGFHWLGLQLQRLVVTEPL